MNLPSTRKVITRGGDGVLRLAQERLPELKPGMVLVRVFASLVSPGTELGGWQAYADKRKNPNPDEKHTPFGYSNAGVVEALGHGVAGLHVGDRVACIGWGYAQHTDFAVVPQNLCVATPSGVSFEQASYAMLLATAMHALRRGTPEFGEKVCIVGLGLVGLLSARLYQLAGCYPIGWESSEHRRALAKLWDIPSNTGSVEETRLAVGPLGLDAAVLANSGPCDETIDRLVDCMKQSPDGHRMGKVMVIGWPVFSYGGKLGGMNNVDIRRCSRTGYGYHDPEWERGANYPDTISGWTTTRNLELCMDLLAAKRVDVDALTTHRVPLGRVESDLNASLDHPKDLLGVVFLPQEA